MTPLTKPLFTDNGPHYHNSAVLMYLTEVNSVFSLKLVKLLDMHFAHVSHKLVHWVRVGNDVESGDQLADLLKVNDLHAVV